MFAKTIYAMSASVKCFFSKILGNNVPKIANITTHIKRTGGIHTDMSHKSLVRSPYSLHCLVRLF